MSTTEAILEKVSALLPEKQKEVLRFVESLDPSATDSKKPASLTSSSKLPCP